MKSQKLILKKKINKILKCKPKFKKKIIKTKKTKKNKLYPKQFAFATEKKQKIMCFLLILINKKETKISALNDTLMKPTKKIYK